MPPSPPPPPEAAGPWSTSAPPSPATADPAAGVEEHRFPCETCGADARFQPGTDMLVCDHCGSSQSFDAKGFRRKAIAELDFLSAIDLDLPETQMEQTRTVTCTNCAAAVEFDPNVHAMECPFCASPVVTDTGVHRHIKPQAVLPFGLSEDQAREAMTNWLGQLWFAPNGLQDYARKGRKMQGVYVPFWTFDAQTRSRYTGERGTIYYETITVIRDGKRERQQVPRIRWQGVRGRVQRFFDDVLILASKSLPVNFTDGLAPWDLSQLEPYKPEYLAGLRAEGYSIDLSVGYQDARRYMDRIVTRDVKFDIGGDRQRIHSVDTEISDVTFKHILLPIWIAAYKFRGETFRFVVNGRTGRVTGQRPYSRWKIALAVTAGAIIAGAVGYAYAVYG